jgi:hypothetical protein
MKKYDFENFYIGTEANFKECKKPDKPPDYWSFSGSTYWDLGDRVVRWSDHWGPNVASCKWYLDYWTLNLDHCIAGYCLYTDFKSIDYGN